MSTVEDYVARCMVIGRIQCRRPRTGDGPRTVRGGAADLYPWQGCDEWLLLLSATRYEHCDFTAVRPAAPLPPY
ncbi:hypothetical protein AB0J68_10760 [Micromonospora sp. NPDC049580]|uniref:hypothetical protein n=1 Tax=Micromonospora sp. NPDC049580 TaxID=3154832 RepID=UPI003440CDF0